MIKQKMISLFIFTSSIRGMNYGIGTYVSELTCALSGYPDIKIYQVSYNSNKVKEFSILRNRNKIVSIHIPGPKIPHINEYQIAKYASRIIDFLEEIIKKSSKVIIQVNYPSSLSIVKEIKRRFNLPVLNVIHSANWQFLTIGNKQKFLKVWENREEYDKSTLKELLEEKELYEVADKIVSVTAYMRMFVIDHFSINPQKVLVIRNGIDSTKFKILSKQEKVIQKKKLGFRHTDKILLFAGRLDNGKGLHYLLKAFNVVFIKDKNVKLILIGEDSGTESIRQFLSYLKDSWHNVTFTGFIPQSDLIKFYQIADVGIVLSVYDHCPYAAIEMAAHNIPLIISNTEGLNEMFNEQQAFFINPVVDSDGRISFNIDEIVFTILTALYDKKNKITKNYPELIKSKFSGSRMGNEMYKVLINMINCDNK